MKSETIFNFHSTWRGRYGDEHGSLITVYSDFQNPGAWPFMVKRFDIDVDEDTYKEIKTEAVARRISKGAFEKIKGVIASNRSLRYDSDEIDVDVMDGSCDEFYFGCDEYSRTLGGLSVLSTGSYECENYPPEKRSIAAAIYETYEKIIKIIESEGIDLWA